MGDLTEAQVRLVGFAPGEWDEALQMADDLRRNWPERMGARDGVGYRIAGVQGYAYRTKTAIIVRA